jgi:hypothetical protein
MRRREGRSVPCSDDGARVPCSDDGARVMLSLARLRTDLRAVKSQHVRIAEVLDDECKDVYQLRMARRLGCVPGRMQYIHMR